MRTNNREARSMIISVYFILVVFAIFSAIVFSFFASNNLYIILSIIAFTLPLILVHNISKYFEYDSDGLKVVVLNKKLLFVNQMHYKEHKVEFYKNELLGFSFNNYYIYKSLTLLLKDSRGHAIKERFNVTLLAKRKRRYVKQSLRKIVKNNRKQISS